MSRRTQGLLLALAGVIVWALVLMTPVDAARFDFKVTNSWSLDGWAHEPCSPSPRGYGWYEGEITHPVDGTMRVLYRPDVVAKCLAFTERTKVAVAGYHELEPHRHVATSVNIRKRGR
jgi:hypothetical protein